MPPVSATEPSEILYSLPSIIERLDLALIFPSAQPLEVELGAGDGSFLIEYARRHPEHNFLGVERLLGRLRKIQRKALRTGLNNVRALRIESAYLLEYLLPAHSVTALHIYFPDPWPKRKHRRNRLINEAFPDLASRSLTPGGTVFLRTDDADYFSQMRRVFELARGFEIVSTPSELEEVVTDFQGDFQARGIPTLTAAYRCLSGTAEAGHR